MARRVGMRLLSAPIWRQMGIAQLAQIKGSKLSEDERGELYDQLAQEYGESTILYFDLDTGDVFDVRGGLLLLRKAKKPEAAAVAKPPIAVVVPEEPVERPPPPRPPVPVQPEPPRKPEPKKKAEPKKEKKRGRR